MTPSELKAKVEETGSYFFDRNTMRFFGDTMENYGVRSAVVTTSVADNNGDLSLRADVECWELYRKKPVNGGLQTSAYFSKDTFARVRPVR